MGLPSINIIFKELASTAIQRGERGIVALILKDANVPTTNPFTVVTPTDIPSELSTTNKEQIQLALMGYIKPPKKVIVYVLDDEATDYTTAQNYLETVRWDYVAVPSIQTGELSAFATWIKGLRDTKDKKVKAVLPNHAGDHEGIINFATDNIKTATKTYTTAEYCSRIAGMLAGTPLTISATFAPLPEVLDCDKLTKDQMDTAINQGKLILYNDGEKVKIARAVNSLITTTQDKGESFKKIKIVDAMDMIHDDIKKTAEDSFIGKYANSYDNKCLLISAIQTYFDQLELDGILDKGKNKVDLDIASQVNYLRSQGLDVDNMTEKEIKEANTKDKVFLAAQMKILDAIEDIGLNITI